jgi:predicted  nucleic acid-binding Zn-ribbon protein
MKIWIHNINLTRENGLQLTSTTCIQRPILHQKKLDGYNPLRANRESLSVVRLEDRACVGRIFETERIVCVCVLVKLVP